VLSSFRRQGQPYAPGVFLPLLLAALIYGCGASSHSQASPPTTPLVPQAPKGPVSYPFTFSWSGVGPTDVVRVTVVDEAERQLMEFEARGTSVPMPPRLSELIRPGERFSWKVAALDEEGQPVRGSDWIACVRDRD